MFMKFMKPEKPQSVEQQKNESISEMTKSPEKPKTEIEKGVEESEDVPKLEQEWLTLDTNEKELQDYIEKLKQAGPNEKFPIFHGTRGGCYEIATILQSEEKGVKGGEVGHTETYALYPVAAYWIQRDSAGFKYSFERRQMQFPGEPETADTVVIIDEKGLVHIKKGLGYLSLVDFEGEVMFGPRAEVPKEIIKSIKRELSHIQTMRREIRPIMQTINERLKTILNFPADEYPETDSYGTSIKKKLFSLLPLTYEQYKNKTYEQKIKTITEDATRQLEKTKQAVERQLKLIDSLNEDERTIDEVTQKVNSRNNLFWRSRFLTRRFVEKQAASKIKENLMVEIGGFLLWVNCPKSVENQPISSANFSRLA